MKPSADGTCEPRRRFKRKALLLKALGHESRLAIVDRLTRGECCVCDLAKLTGLDQSTVSRHLSILANGGMVAGTRQGHHIYYRLIAPWVRELIESDIGASEPAEAGLGS